MSKFSGYVKVDLQAPQQKENKSLKERFKQRITRLKESFRIDYDDDEFEESD
jgi:hypothetical protein